jgi:hypothetical protein
MNYFLDHLYKQYLIFNQLRRSKWTFFISQFGDPYFSTVEIIVKGAKGTGRKN